MSYACVASTGHWCSFHNQAALPYNSSFSLGTSVESRYMMSAMSLKSITCVIPGRPAPLGLMVSHYGNNQYSVIAGGVSSAVIITEGLSLGVQADIISEHGAGDYRDVTHVTFEGGMLGRLSPSLTAGFHIFNPLSELNDLPSAVRAGLSWQPDDSFTMALEAMKTTSEPLSLHAGLAWHMPRVLILRAGYSSGPSSFSFGVGFFSGTINVDTGFAVNSYTGITPSLSLLWIPGKN